MTETESLIAEVRQLHAEVAAVRADVARLHAAHTPVHIRHGWMNLLLKDLSTNPYTQYKVHMWGAIYWLINFPLICCLFFFTPTLWLKLGIFITLIYSIYANLATDYGACRRPRQRSGSRRRRRSHLSHSSRYEAAQISPDAAGRASRCSPRPVAVVMANSRGPRAAPVGGGIEA